MQTEPTNNQEPNINSNTNPNTDTNPNMEGEQDQTSDILACLGALRCLNSLFRGGYHLRQSLAKELDTITNTIANAQGALYNISSYRESMKQYYSYGLSYKDTKN